MDAYTVFLLAAAFGVIPMAFFAVVITWFDRYERDPRIILFSTFVWGLIVASGAALVLNTLFGISIYQVTRNPVLSYDLTAVLFGPAIEESVKGAVILLLFLFFKKDFNTLLDGIIYGSLVGLGFAAAENTLYIYGGYTSAGATGFFTVAILRTLFIPFMHAAFTSITGLGFAGARVYRKGWFISPIACFSLAVLLHSLHNYVAISGNMILQSLGFVFDWLGVIVILSIIAYLIRREKKIMQENLGDEIILGTLTQKQYETAISGFRKAIATWTGTSAESRKKATRFYDLAQALAFKKYEQKNGGETDQTLAKEIDETRKQMKETSAQI